MRVGGRCVCCDWRVLARTGHNVRACCCRDVDVASVYKVVNYLTRLETRIAEFSVAASQWVRETQRRNESERTHDLLQLK